MYIQSFTSFKGKLALIDSYVAVQFNSKTDDERNQKPKEFSHSLSIIPTVSVIERHCSLSLSTIGSTIEPQTRISTSNPPVKFYVPFISLSQVITTP